MIPKSPYYAVVFSFFLFYALTSCHEEHLSKDNNKPPLLSIMFYDDFGHEFVPFYVKGGYVHVFIPKTRDSKALHIKFLNNDCVFVEIGSGRSGPQIKESQTFDFSDLTKPVMIKQVVPKGLTYDWIVKTYDIPVMVIQTPNSQPIKSKYERVEGCEVKIIENDSVTIELGAAGIRGRGNSSWDQPKKPYNIKFDHKQGPLGMNKSKHWILLAHAYHDRTQIHNATAFEIMKIMDYPWVQDGRFVELILNGEHKGLYFLVEKIRVEKDKIDIEEMNIDNWGGQKLEGGYLLESNTNPDVVDNSFATSYFNKTGYFEGWELGWEVKSPEVSSGLLPSNLKELIKNDLNYIESLIYNPDSLAIGNYRLFFDIETAINWWLTGTLAACEEMSSTKNMFIYKKSQNDKLCCGPNWDFDAWTFGTGGVKIVGFMETAFYYDKLYNDPVFCKRLKEKFNQFKPQWEKIIPLKIDSLYEYVHRSAERNEIMWPNWWPGYEFPQKSYKQNVIEMKQAFMTQLEYMDIMINKQLGEWMNGYKE